VGVHFPSTHQTIGFFVFFERELERNAKTKRDNRVVTDHGFTSKTAKQADARSIEANRCQWERKEEKKGGATKCQSRRRGLCRGRKRSVHHLTYGEALLK
jgi:hypothetical protein